MKSKNTPNGSSTGLEALLQLIPSNALAEELIMVISANYLRMRYETAQAVQTGNITLAAKEHERFMENCRAIKAISLGIELRNYLLWEVYSTEQFRETDQDFIAFGTRLTELSPSQLRKCVHAGRIRMEMIRANLDEVRPTGRQVEELSKIEDKHTMDAWIYALDYMRENGRSDATALEALRDYCKIKKIQFGKRSPNGSSKLGLARISRKGKKTKDQESSASKLNPNGIEWDLSSREQELLLSIDPISDESTDSPDRDERLSRCIAALKTVASSNASSDYEVGQMEALLALVARKDEATARSLVIAAWARLRELLTEATIQAGPPDGVFLGTDADVAAPVA